MDKPIKVARVTGAPAGESAQARGGEFERMMEGLRQTERYLAARYEATVVRGYTATPRAIEFDTMRNAVLRAIEELKRE